MTREEEAQLYREGFDLACKLAHVDPAALSKTAQPDFGDDLNATNPLPSATPALDTFPAGPTAEESAAARRRGGWATGTTSPVRGANASPGPTPGPSPTWAGVKNFFGINAMGSAWDRYNKSRHYGRGVLESAWDAHHTNALENESVWSKISPSKLMPKRTEDWYRRRDYREHLERNPHNANITEEEALNQPNRKREQASWDTSYKTKTDRAQELVDRTSRGGLPANGRAPYRPSPANGRAPYRPSGYWGYGGYRPSYAKKPTGAPPPEGS